MAATMDVKRTGWVGYFLNVVWTLSVATWVWMSPRKPL